MILYDLYNYNNYTKDKVSMELNKDEALIFKLNGLEVSNVVEVPSIDCDENVETLQFIGSKITVSERGSRLPYQFEIDIKLFKSHTKYDTMWLDIQLLRQLREPLEVIFKPLNEHNIEKLNILSYNETDYATYKEIVLSCEEFIEYDRNLKFLTDETVTQQKLLEFTLEDVDPDIILQEYVRRFYESTGQVPIAQS